MPRAALTVDQRTVGYLIEHNRKVRWRCTIMPDSHSGDVDLHRIARKKGGTFSLANRRPPCRIPGCPGRVRFDDATSLYWQSLDTITDRNDAWWSFNDAERARAEALGYRVEMGKWVAPETTKAAPDEPERPR